MLCSAVDIGEREAEPPAAQDQAQARAVARPVDPALAAFAGLRSSLDKRLERADPGKRAAQ